MADPRFTLLLALGFLIAAHGADKHDTYGDVDHTTEGKKDLLSIILPPNLASVGARATETGNKTSELFDDIIEAIFEVRNPLHPGNSSSHENISTLSSENASEAVNRTSGSLNNVTTYDDRYNVNVASVVNEGRLHSLQSTPNSLSNGHFHSHHNGDFNAGSASNAYKTPDTVNAKANENRAPGDPNGSNSSHMNYEVKRNLSEGVPGESNVHFPDEEIHRETGGTNGSAKDDVSKKDGIIDGKYFKETTDKLGPVEVEPYHIIDAPPFRESDDNHGCRLGQRWVFGHCRDIIESR